MPEPELPSKEKERATELEYLRYFFHKVQPCLGPADSEIIEMIGERFCKETGKDLPEGYGRDGG